MIDEKYLDGDPKLIWQDQIAGVIDYDYSDFIGALADLQSDPDWREAFGAIASAPGMPGFLDRLQGHFELCGSSAAADGGVHPYQHPSRTAGTRTPDDKAESVELAKRYLRTVADVEEGSSTEHAERLRRMKVSWTDDPAAVDDDPYSRDGAPADLSLHETMGGIDGRKIEGAPAIMSELREACYGLAADHELQRYLMRSFHTHSHDVDTMYELTWKRGCEIYFDDSACHVYDARAYRAWKRARQES